MENDKSMARERLGEAALRHKWEHEEHAAIYLVQGVRYGDLCTILDEQHAPVEDTDPMTCQWCPRCRSQGRYLEPSESNDVVPSWLCDECGWTWDRPPELGEIPPEKRTGGWADKEYIFDNCAECRKLGALLRGPKLCPECCRGRIEEIEVEVARLKLGQESAMTDLRHERERAEGAEAEVKNVKAEISRLRGKTGYCPGCEGTGRKIEEISRLAHAMADSGAVSTRSYGRQIRAILRGGKK